MSQEKPSRFGVAGAMMGLVAVGCGAFGAHGLKGVLSVERLANWQTATEYLFVHALATLLVTTLLATPAYAGRSSIAGAGAAFVLGGVIFSGTLYLLAVTGILWLGAITPIGGLSFIAGWLLLAVGLRRA